MNKDIENNKKYNQPQIEEAVFDLRIRRGDSFNKNLFDSFLEKTENYTFKDKLQNIDINTKTMSQNIDTFAYRAISEDQKQIVQFQKFGFSFSRLKVYNGWQKNCKEALRLWDIYYKIMEPQAITRVATRFINRFQIPTNTYKDISTYLETYIKYDEQNISPAWNQMSYRLFLSHDNGIKSYIVFDNKVDPVTDKVDIIFDIDVFSDGQIDSLNLKNKFDQLREIKNKIFEQSITDKIRDIIK